MSEDLTTNSSKTVEIAVAEKTYAAVNGIKNFAGVVKKQLADGWQADQDISPIMASALSDLLMRLQDYQGIVAESEGNKLEFADAIYLGLRDFFIK